jgi:hypothetical protein
MESVSRSPQVAIAPLASNMFAPSNEFDTGSYLKEVTDSESDDLNNLEEDWNHHVNLTSILLRDDFPDYDEQDDDDFIALDEDFDPEEFDLPDDVYLTEDEVMYEDSEDEIEFDENYGKRRSNFNRDQVDSSSASVYIKFWESNVGQMLSSLNVMKSKALSQDASFPSSSVAALSISQLVDPRQESEPIPKSTLQVCKSAALRYWLASLVLIFIIGMSIYCAMFQRFPWTLRSNLIVQDLQTFLTDFQTGKLPFKNSINSDL